MADIRQVAASPWRDALLPAHFNGAMFHVEAGSKESGRRIVSHEYPKRDNPPVYSEDMGRKFVTWTVRGYCVQYPRDTDISLFKRDYREARDILIGQLEAKGTGILQLPTLKPMRVQCSRYRVTEEQRFGGYCVFDMTFVEYGMQPDFGKQDSAEQLKQASIGLRQQVVNVLGIKRGRLGKNTPTRGNVPAVPPAVRR